MNRWDFRTPPELADSPKSEVCSRCEKPALAFADYGVAFHLAAEVPAALSDSERKGSLGQAHSSLEQRALESYERDMLLYAYRHVAPLQTRPVGTSSRLSLTVVFPHELVFESEGNPIRLLCAGTEEQGRVRHATISASQTRFDRSTVSGQSTVSDGSTVVSILTLALRPPSPVDPLAGLNEYDVIKLAKLWEGGERLPEPGSPDEEAGPVQFQLDGDEIRLQELARRLVPGHWGFLDYRSEQLAFAMTSPAAESPSPTADQDFRPHYRIGTITLKLPATWESRRLLADALAVKELSERVPEYGSPRWRRVVALGGLIQGLLDFEQIGPDELSDVFAEAELEDESLLAFHKGTLLSVALEGSAQEEERDAELARPIGMSPYLVIPHVVLLHNELRLKSALIDVNELLRGQERGDPPLPALRRYLPLRNQQILVGARRTSIDQTEVGIRKISEGLAQHLPNIFHYESERELYKSGTRLRGFGDFEPLITARLGELQGTLESRVRQRDNWTLGLTIAFFAVAALQLAVGKVTLWVSLPLLAALAVVVWLLRRKLF